jgi:hypothetical protein
MPSQTASKPFLNKSVELNKLNLNPSSHFPFQNAVLTEGKYIIVKNQTKEGNRLQESC